MKKKLVSILLCAALAVSAFTGCGSSDPEEEAKSKAAAEGSGTEICAGRKSRKAGAEEGQQGGRQGGRGGDNRQEGRSGR